MGVVRLAALTSNAQDHVVGARFIAPCIDELFNDPLRSQLALAIPECDLKPF
jgi:hypothetical protein